MQPGVDLALRVTSRRGPRPPHGWQRDIVVTVSPQHSVDDLRIAVADHVGLPIGAIGSTRLGALDATLGVLATGLLNGDELVADSGPVASSPIAVSPATNAFTPGGDGTIPFQRTPYRPVVVAEGKIQRIGGFPAEHERRRLQFWSMLAPLAAGVVLFAFSRQPQFLALTLISPLAVAAQTIDDRRSGRRRSGRRVAEFRAELARRVAALERMRADELAWRRRAAPDLAALGRRAEQRSVDLWERRRDGADAMRLRLGSGPCPTNFRVVVDEHGSPDLRQEALDAVAGLDLHQRAPVTVDLTSSVVALHGDDVVVRGMAAALVVQASVLHSPDALSMVAAVAPDRRLEWMRWLPHAQHGLGSIAGCPVVVASTPDAELLKGLIELGERRLASDRRWPHVMAVLDAAVCVDSVLVTQLLEIAVPAGFGVVWLASALRQVPHGATVVIDVSAGAGATRRARLWSRDPGSTLIEFEGERIGYRAAERIARWLAPVRDVTAGGPTAAIPAVVGLCTALECEAIDAEWVRQRWACESDEHRLPVALGLGVAGEVVGFDFVADGPHVLIGGTSGAGKSELLQSLVTSAASRCSPSRLNFLFVDFKGGAAFSVFQKLPHTAGYVTNLDGALSDRVLVSLRAELQRRMQLLEGHARDVTEMVRVAPDLAPPALVIVIDEFATLIKEVPGFVAGIVDIAQRGRSLGIHLVLATQRPSGAISDDIVANVSIRIALRVLDLADSRAILGSAEAAEISAANRGRAVVKFASSRCVHVQTAYGGMPVVEQTSDPYPVVRDLADCGRSDVRSSRGASGQATQLELVLAAIDAAATRHADGHSTRTVWCPPLPDRIGLEELQPPVSLLTPRHARRCPLVLGLLDAPDQQLQQALRVELDTLGGILIYGAPGAGKSMAIKAVVASLVRGGAPVSVIGFDCGWHGLVELRRTRQVVDVVNGHDPEALTRTIAVLELELARRSALATATGYDGERIVVAVDGWGALADALGEHPSAPGYSDSWLERLVRVLVDGRRFGIHAVLTCDRRAVIPTRLHAVLSGSLVLRLADPNQYAEHGMSIARTPEIGMPPGRGWWGSSMLVQIADAGTALEVDSSVRAPHPLSSDALPTRVALPIRGCEGLQVPFGMVDVLGTDAVLDLAWSHAAVVGGRRSGRSTALAAIERQLADNVATVAIGGPNSGLASASVGSDSIAADLDRLLTRIESRRLLEQKQPPIVLLVDDADQLDDPSLMRRFEAVLCSPPVRLVGSVDTRALTGFSASPLLTELKRARRMIALQPDDPNEWLAVTGVKLRPRPGLRLPPGRGVLLADRRITWIHVAENVQVFDEVLRSGT